MTPKKHNDMSGMRVWPASDSGGDAGIGFPLAIVGQAMGSALDAARSCAEAGEVPVGAAVFTADEIIAVAGNARERGGDPTAHAEITALRGAAAPAGKWRLEDCGMAVTLEPCPMCAGALVNARLQLLVYGAADPKAGAAGSLYNICQDRRLNHRMQVASGFRANEARRLLADFFGTRRSKLL